MSIEEAIVEKVRALPPERQQEVLAFVTSLEHRGARKRPLRSAEGLWADLGISITDEDIAEARREMWGNFPREFPLDLPEGSCATGTAGDARREASRLCSADHLVGPE